MQIGQKVQCIDDVFPAPLAKHFTSLPVKGETYHIRAIYPGRRVMYPNGLNGSDGEVGLLLQEITNPPDPKTVYGLELGFNSKRFRPLDTLPDEEERELVGVGISRESREVEAPKHFPIPHENRADIDRLSPTNWWAVRLMHMP